MLFKVCHQRITIVGARVKRTDGVQLQIHMFSNTQRTPPARGQQNQLRINIRPLQTEGFDTQLMELTITPFLRTLVAEHRPDIPQALFLIVQETMFDTGAYATRRPFRTQRQAVAITILKGVHLFFNHVSDFTDSAFE